MDEDAARLVGAGASADPGDAGVAAVLLGIGDATSLLHLSKGLHPELVLPMSKCALACSGSGGQQQRSAESDNST